MGDLGHVTHRTAARPYFAGEVAWAVRREMARTVEDVLARRTRALLLDARASLAVALKVAAIMARKLERDESWTKTQVAAYSDLVAYQCVARLESPVKNHAAVNTC